MFRLGGLGFSMMTLRPGRLAPVTATFVGPVAPVDPVASSSARLVPAPLLPRPKLLRLTPQPVSMAVTNSNKVLNRTLGDRHAPASHSYCSEPLKS
jgi:hypothetical protein